MVRHVVPQLLQVRDGDRQFDGGTFVDVGTGTRLPGQIGQQILSIRTIDGRDVGSGRDFDVCRVLDARIPDEDQQGLQCVVPLTPLSIPGPEEPPVSCGNTGKAVRGQDSPVNEVIGVYVPAPAGITETDEVPALHDLLLVHVVLSQGGQRVRHRPVGAEDAADEGLVERKDAE